MDVGKGQSGGSKACLEWGGCRVPRLTYREAWKKL